MHSKQVELAFRFHSGEITVEISVGEVDATSLLVVNEPVRSLESIPKTIENLAEIRLWDSQKDLILMVLDQLSLAPYSPFQADYVLNSLTLRQLRFSSFLPATRLPPKAWENATINEMAFIQNRGKTFTIKTDHISLEIGK